MTVLYSTMAGQKKETPTTNIWPVPWGGISPGEAFEVWVLSIPCFWSLRCFFWLALQSQPTKHWCLTLECSSLNRSRRWKWWFYRGCHLYILVHARGVVKQQHGLRSEWRAFQQQVIYKTLWSLRCWCQQQDFGELYHDYLNKAMVCICGFLDVRIRKSEKAIFTSGSSDFSGRRVWRFFVPGIPGTVRRRFFFHVGRKMREKVLRRSPKNLNAWMMRYAWCWGVFFDIYWYLLLSWKIHKECINWHVFQFQNEKRGKSDLGHRKNLHVMQLHWGLPYIIHTCTSHTCICPYICIYIYISIVKKTV